MDISIKKSKHSLYVFLLPIIIFLFVIVTLYKARSILSPFVTSFVLSYVLNPYNSKLQKIIKNRSFSVILILITFFSIFFIILFAGLPILYSEASNLIMKFPDYITRIYGVINDLISSSINERFSEVIKSINVPNMKDVFVQNVFFKTGIFSKVFHSSTSIISFFTSIFLLPMIMFFLMRDWDIIVSSLKMLIPKKHYEAFNNQLNEIDKLISCYIIGQFKVCIILGLMYGIALFILGLNYSFLISVITGVLSFIPYVGTFFAFICSNLIALSQFNLYMIIALNCVLISGQFLEGFIITPKIIGKSVNLNPLWILFSIFTGGAIWGFAGVCVAVPLAITFRVVINHQIKEYKKSKLYLE